jgi:hypothetical protein
VIYLWLRAAAIFILKLLIPPPPAPVIPKIDPCSPCPSCGHCKGRISAVEVKGEMLVRHDCDVCNANWHVRPVTKHEAVHAQKV